MIDLWDKRRDKNAEAKLSIKFFHSMLAKKRISFAGRWYKLNARTMNTLSYKRSTKGEPE